MNDRIRKLTEEEKIEYEIRFELQPFFSAMCKEIARHVPEKGYGYRNREWVDYFKTEAVKLSARYLYEEDNIDEALDAAAMLCFAWMHDTGLFEAEKMEMDNAGECRYNPDIICEIQKRGSFTALKCEYCDAKYEYVEKKMKPEPAKVVEPKSRW